MPSKRTFVDHNGLTFSGPSYAGVVRDMKRYGWFMETKGNYMRDVAARVAELTAGRAQLATHSPSAFLASLVEYDFLKELLVEVQPERSPSSGEGK